MMKTLFMLIIPLTALLLAQPVLGKVNKDCTCNGRALYGKVKVVENFPDFTVKIVSNFPDLKVELVNNWPNNCGQWQMVENFPDFTIKFVDNFPDFTIEYVNNFPGVP